MISGTPFALINAMDNYLQNSISAILMQLLLIVSLKEDSWSNSQKRSHVRIASEIQKVDKIDPREDILGSLRASCRNVLKNLSHQNI